MAAVILGSEDTALNKTDTFCPYGISVRQENYNEQDKLMQQIALMEIGGSRATELDRMTGKASLKQ